MARKMGRPRQPTALKIARGTHRADRDGDPNAEPDSEQLAVDTPPPVKMNQFEKKIWKTILSILAPHGLVTQLDVPALVEYVRDCRLAQRLRDRIDKDGIMVDGAMGTIKTHPALTSLNQVRARVTAFESKFGMTPSDRQGLDVKLDRGQTGVQRRQRG